MKQAKTLAAVLVLASAGQASAGGTEGSVGVGAEFGISGVGGVSVNYDAGKFHVGGFLGFSDGSGGDDTDYTLGGRFFFHVGSTAMSDFGVGGTLGLLSIDDRNLPGGERAQLMFLEPSFQIRVFLASNVALSFSAGIVIGFVDAEGVAVGSQSSFIDQNGTILGGAVTGTAGVHYYFD